MLRAVIGIGKASHFSASLGDSILFQCHFFTAADVDADS